MFARKESDLLSSRLVAGGRHGASYVYYGIRGDFPEVPCQRIRSLWQVDDDTVCDVVSCLPWIGTDPGHECVVGGQVGQRHGVALAQGGRVVHPGLGDEDYALHRCF